MAHSTSVPYSYCTEKPLSLSSFRSPTVAVLGFGIRRGRSMPGSNEKTLIQKAMKRVLFSLFSVPALIALQSREVHPMTSWLLPQMASPKLA